MTEDYKAENEKGYIKLYKNTKGYNWEIKFYEGKDKKLYEEIIEEIEALNQVMLNKFMEV